MLAFYRKIVYFIMSVFFDGTVFITLPVKGVRKSSRYD